MRCKPLEVLWIASIIQSIALATPLPGLRFCGRNLADALAAICDDRGYNLAFRPELVGSDNDRRFRRGIVDECCHMGCTISTLETYCRPRPSDAPSTDDLPARLSRHVKLQRLIPLSLGALWSPGS